MFDLVKKYFTIGIYSDEDVKKFVLSGKITADEYKELTNKDFEWFKYNFYNNESYFRGSSIWKKKIKLTMLT